MPISVISEFIPLSSGNYPIVDVGNVRGAYWSVPTSTDRDAINSNNRKIGMSVHVQDINRTYRLVGGITNSDWQFDTSIGLGYATGIVAASSWTINHNLGYYPNVSIINTSGNLSFGTINHVSVNTVQIFFNQNISGTGYLS